MIQGQNHRVGIAGILVPGLGQLLRGEFVAALVTLVSVFTPVLWFFTLVNQLIINGSPGPKRTALQGDFIDGFQSLPGVPPEYYGLLFLALSAHIIAAHAAWRGPLSRPTSTLPEEPQTLVTAAGAPLEERAGTTKPGDQLS